MSSILRLDRNVIPGSDETRLFAKVRNEARRLPFFLSYYRRLGVNRFFIVDNGSTDGTLERLRESPDCHTFVTTETMSETNAGMHWIQPLLHRYGHSRWCVVVDADELLVYPDSEVVPLREFCRTLELVKADAFVCIMLDMYSDGNIEDVQYKAEQSFLDACPYFDRTGYRWLASRTKGPAIFGGPRLRMFYPEFLDRSMYKRIQRRFRAYCGQLFPKLKPASPPRLSKVPLVKWNETMSFGPGAHELSFGHPAKGHGALLHFKFLGDFSGQVKEELDRKAYFDDGREYRRYFERIRTQVPINFMCDISMRFAGSRQLLELGLIKENST